MPFRCIRNPSRAVAVLVRRDVLDAVKEATLPESVKQQEERCKMTRREALEEVLDLVDDSDFIVTTTGYTSRELYAIQTRRREQSSDKLVRPTGGQLYMVGSMGHALSIAQGIALAQPQRRVWCIDGDGTLQMHVGSLVSTASLGTSNLVHVLLNNSCHESVGGQRTAASQDEEASKNGPIFPELARAANYSQVFSVATREGLQELANFTKKEKAGSTFIEIITCVDETLNKDLPRPKETLLQFKEATCTFLQN